MSDKTCWESVKAEGGAILDKLKDLLHEGNIRRVRVRQGDRTIAEFPLTAGVVGALFAPALAAIGALVAVANDCSIDVERETSNSSSVDSPAAGTAGACWARTAVEATTSNAAASRYVLRAIE